MLYKDQLKTKEWQKRRLEIIARDSSKCRNCGKVSKQPHVHHLYYELNKMAWEYSDKALVTLCPQCHKQLHKPANSTTELFYITFLDGMEAILTLTRMLDVKVLAVLCSKAEFNTGTVQLTPFIREAICNELNISYNSLANSLSSLKKKDFIQIYKGNCVVNPLFFWKGDLKTREELLRNSELSFTINFSNQ